MCDAKGILYQNVCIISIIWMEELNGAGMQPSCITKSSRQFLDGSCSLWSSMLVIVGPGVAPLPAMPLTS
jgi:hypothetical protein